MEAVQKAIEERLLGCNASRTYFTQALLPGAAVPVSCELLGEGGEKKDTDSKQPPTYAYKMVRTDAREQKLDAFFGPKSQQLPLSTDLSGSSLSGSHGEGSSSAMDVEESSSAPTAGGKKRAVPSCGALEQPFKRKVRRKEVKLTSVKTLQQSIRTRMHKGRISCIHFLRLKFIFLDPDLMELFQNHTFVGCVDQTRALVQHQTKLYLIDVSRVT